MKKVVNKKSATKVSKSFHFKARVVVWAGSGYKDKGEQKGAWRFARVPENISAKIKKLQEGKLRRGWGAVYADAKVGKTKWRTSIFPDRHSSTYLLPLKKEVRYEENLYDGEEFLFKIEI